MKKVDEGVELFDEIWEKVYSADTQNQKEKYEVDLKKEIKKLQRLRDQIKTWISSSDVKDKDSLLDARKLIETKMEQFKICEKETKTKTYSKEGLARAERLSPEEQAKEDTCKWVGETIEKLQQLVEDKDVEIEQLSSGKGKKSNKHQIEELMEFIQSFKFHINKLEGIMRLVMNDVLDHDLVDDLKEDLEYYCESYNEEEYMQSYDEEYFYESLGLEDIGVVNVDRVTQAQTTKSVSSKNDDASSSTSTSKDKKSKKKAGTNSVIPLTIGRARTKKEDKDNDKDTSTPTKKAPATNTTPALGPSPAAPATRPPTVVNANGGASMAAILKREGEQQEKERQKQAALQQAQQQRLLQEQQARQQAELQRQQLQRQQEQFERQQEELRQQQAAAQQKTQQEALQRQQQQLQAEQQRKQQEAAVLKQHQLAQQAAQQQLLQQRSQSSTPGAQKDAIDLLPSGLGGLSLGDNSTSSISPSANRNAHQQSAKGEIGSPTSGNFDISQSYLGALDESFLYCPSNADSERQRTYTPRNPYPTPSSYPSAPSLIFENPAIFEKLGTDCLFFIFYYAQGTYQQYLAARELKKQSWRYHKKYMTWFQRHEEPKVTTEDYEQGTYVYFDYESGWCQRIKSDFRFEYSYLEDSLQ